MRPQSTELCLPQNDVKTQRPGTFLESQNLKLCKVDNSELGNNSMPFIFSKSVLQYLQNDRWAWWGSTCLFINDGISRGGACIPPVLPPLSGT